MGLDMYLYANKRISTNYNNEKEMNFANKVAEYLGAKDLYGSGDLRTAQISFEVAYWRKANEIHNFFISKCANGVDNCQTIDVERGELEELLELCKYVIEHPEEAEQKLPTKSGFFFGSTDYDDYYFSDLKETVTVLEKVLKLKDIDFFTYRASW
jgi:hypothetical protein